MDRKPLNTSDEELDIEEEFNEIEDVREFDRNEGHIYESIEEELEAIELSELDFIPEDFDESD